jgi:2,3-bisphosphoglycerate-dependent phosphoglycerate mutase
MSQEPKLVLLRHGESLWNAQGRFTGWVDIPLSAKGVQESIEAGKQLSSVGIDRAFVSSLVRAQTTLVLVLLEQRTGKTPYFLHPLDPEASKWERIDCTEVMSAMLPVHVASELNERMYGDLQGNSKLQVEQDMGQDVLKLWRRSYRQGPPGGESLKKTKERVYPYFEQEIAPCLDRGETVLVVAHGNSLRAILMGMFRMSEEKIVDLEVPTGRPLVYAYRQGVWVAL